MKEVEQASCVVQIGDSAGMVWKALSDNGAMTMAQLVKNVGQPRHGDAGPGVAGPRRQDSD